MNIVKTLLWKDYRQNRAFLTIAGISLLVPYAFAALVRIVDLARYGNHLEEGWGRYIEFASLTGLGISVVLCAFVAGNAMAGERVDRSAEFTACLPIPHGSAVLSKAILAVGVCTLMLAANGLIYYAVMSMHGRLFSSEPHPGAVVLVATAVLVFGVSWLASAVVSRPVSAAAAGLLALVIAFMGAAIADEIKHARVDMLSYCLVCLTLGAGCFIAGTMHYVRRVEP